MAATLLVSKIVRSVFGESCVLISVCNIAIFSVSSESVVNAN